MPFLEFEFIEQRWGWAVCACHAATRLSVTYEPGKSFVIIGFFSKFTVAEEEERLDQIIKMIVENTDDYIPKEIQARRSKL